jgi:hypothetical protein
VSPLQHMETQTSESNLRLDRSQLRAFGRFLGCRRLVWDEVEAWVCRGRLARDLAEHQQNPAAPRRSLLEP